MTIATTVAAFQSLHGSIAGVNSAPTAMPQSLQAMRLPFVFTWPGPTGIGRGWKPAAGWYIHNRIYIVRCYAKPLTQGSGFDDGYQIAVDLLQKFGEAYVTNQTLSGAVAHLGPEISDSGVRGDMQWVAGSEIYYTGFEFRIEVAEKTST
jgi:hypothetical protein